MSIDPQATGRYLVLLCPERTQEGLRQLSALTGLRVMTAEDDRQRRRSGAESRSTRCAIVFDRIGVALVSCADGERQRLDAASLDAETGIMAVEPERTVHAIVTSRKVRIPELPDVPADAASLAYVRGYRDAINDLAARLKVPEGGAVARMPRPQADESTSTWGIQATKADVSTWTGKGIRLAVLDTGIDLQHPDFAGRRIVSRSFVDGEDVQDGNGHGTHCAGIACGPRAPAVPPRYGVAGEAELHVGKVLSNAGAGADGSVLEGINWAIEQQCAVVSMSLGSTAGPDEPYSLIFEEVARRALAAGTVLIAAAGNDSQRPEFIAPVSHPANCPSIFAVGAVDSSLQVAPFSCGGLVEEGGQVDLAAPGVNIRSSWPGEEQYHSISGTSMATPFVAGIAALYAQAESQARGRALLNLVVQNARRLSQPSRDVGAGLVQAPVPRPLPASLPASRPMTPVR
ncbi:S8 family serine peptidase [Parapusillimonas sp. SGNA-6]|nr:S8 family serine peptidase [Parapusillimonas sp. SGNA-6]